MNKKLLERMILFCLTASLLTLSIASADKMKQKKKTSVSSNGNKLCLVLINFDSFSCSPCLDRFIDFCQAIPEPVQEKRLKGIIVYTGAKERKNSRIQAQIVEKKLEGFIQANNIRFPFVLDHSHLFNALAKEGFLAILFDQEKKVVKKYVLPLEARELDEFLDYFLN